MSGSWQRYTDGKLFLAQWHHDRASDCVGGLGRRAHEEAADALLAQAWRGLLNELLERSGQKARVDTLEDLEAFYDPVPPEVVVLRQEGIKPEGWVSLLLARLKRIQAPESAGQGAEEPDLLASDRLTPQAEREKIFTGFQGYLSALRATWQEF
ncbi:MAG: hypothetical protein D6758_11205 [Gammaproteobacteria bacterium]|nr:MAG: hypothetical protein D6758_11205 [Gammaproteobacteria bacterium]